MSRLGKRQLHELYYYLKLTRRVEEVLARLHREEKVTGPLCFVAGLEAVSVGAVYWLGSGDLLASSLPSLGSIIARGVRPVEIFSHFLGRADSSSRGRDGSILLGSFERGLVAPTGHPATHLGVMAGVALAMKTMEKKSVGVALMSAKSLATGDFHEGLNFAAVQKLPLIVVVENDPDSFTSSLILEGQYLHERMKGYGIPGIPVEGVDILQVLQVMEAAMERARKGPTLIEARTSHLVGHAFCEKSVPFPFSVEDSMGRDRTEQSSESRDANGQNPENHARDPIEKFETFLVDHRLLQPVERGLIEERIEQLIEMDLQEAEASPLPDPNIADSGVYNMRETSND